MSHIWMQSRFGRRVDMLDTSPAEVNWWELCLQLADNYRYAGCAKPNVSIAYHSILVYELAHPSVKPYALIHDFHEGPISDITTPTAQAIAQIASDIGPSRGVPGRVAQGLVVASIKNLKRRHDLAIWAAAGLPEPTEEQEALIREADIRALVTEVRDFMREPPMPWGEPYASMTPWPIKLTGFEYGATPDAIAQTLYSTLFSALPALRMTTAEIAA